ncbi:hypothetical protein [Kistimonas asteriae]|uniref:hypothetical protein n=1 Tax=Kistimonas asteriae TaxID=517724 RepID=UPI001BAD47C1|nr:hypothetical protein [Kistimonas asteriae]
MNKLVLIYERKGSLFLGANQQTTAGVWLDAGPYFTCSSSDEEATIGSLCLQALEHSKSGVPHPKTHSGMTKPLLLAAGVKSYRTFIKGTKMCMLSASDKYEITPCRNGGSTGNEKGFHEIAEKTQYLQQASNVSQLGKAVIQALIACTEK